MSARSRRRRARGEGLPVESKPRAALRLPLLPMVAGAAGLLLLGAAWTTRWTPGEPREAETSTRFTVEIAQDQQRVINSWERFFICYDLLDPAVVDLTLRANQRATGSLDFPGERIEVELPSGRAPDEQQRPTSGAEDEIIAVRHAVLNAAVPERMAQIRQQCAGGTAGG